MIYVRCVLEEVSINSSRDLIMSSNSKPKVAWRAIKNKMTDLDELLMREDELEEERDQLKEDLKEAQKAKHDLEGRLVASEETNLELKRSNEALVQELEALKAEKAEWEAKKKSSDGKDAWVNAKKVYIFVHSA